jgi:hypothetical protein
MTELTVIAIDPDRLDEMRKAGVDEHGNQFTALAAGGGEPLRCCLRIAGPDEAVALISYAPFTEISPWREVGPVWVHADRCAGYPDPRSFPEPFRRGPRLLRTYHADGTLDYDHIELVPDGADVESAVRTLLARPEVAEVHLRSVLPQCFTFAVRSG